jgi:hypothetical protein
VIVALVFWKDSLDFEKIMQEVDAELSVLQVGAGNINSNNMNNRKVMTAVDQELEKNPYVREANEVIRLFQEFQGPRANA